MTPFELRAQIMEALHDRYEAMEIVEFLFDYGLRDEPIEEMVMNVLEADPAFAVLIAEELGIDID